MKKRYPEIAAFIFLTIMATLVHAENAPKPEPIPMKGMGGMHHGMGGMMAMTEEQKDQHMRSMQEHMLKMHELSNQILAEKDPAKKEQLKNEQLQLMKAHHAQMMGGHQQMTMPAPKK